MCRLDANDIPIVLLGVLFAISAFMIYETASVKFGFFVKRVYKCLKWTYSIAMRNKFEIVCDVLKACREPVCKTRIMGLTNLNYGYVTEVLKELLEKKMLATVDGKYLVTSYGLGFLESLEVVLSMWYGVPVATVFDLEAEEPETLKKTLERINKASRSLK